MIWYSQKFPAIINCKNHAKTHEINHVVLMNWKIYLQSISGSVLLCFSECLASRQLTGAVENIRMNFFLKCVQNVCFQIPNVQIYWKPANFLAKKSCRAENRVDCATSVERNWAIDNAPWGEIDCNSQRYCRLSAVLESGKLPEYYVTKKNLYNNLSTAPVSP